jgi:protein-disulfide isomerase
MPLYFSMDEDHKLTKDEKKALRKLEWQAEAAAEVRNTKIKKLATWIGAILVILVVVFVLFQTATSSPSTPTLKIAPVSARDIKKGNPKAKLTLIEYADFECSACAVYHPVVNQILNNYKNKIYYVYRMFPLEQSHPNAFVSAQAAYAAYKQGAFFNYDDMLYGKQTEWATLQDPITAFADYATLLNLNVDKFKTDMNSAQTKKYIQDSEDQALKEGINYTPSFFINGNLIQNPNDYTGFKKLIDDALSK